MQTKSKFCLQNIFKNFENKKKFQSNFEYFVFRHQKLLVIQLSYMKTVWLAFFWHEFFLF